MRSKAHHIFFILALFVVFGIFSQTNAQNATITAENANLRDSPANTGKIITTLANGTELVVLSQSGGWFKVRSGKNIGWVHGNAIKLDDVSQAAVDSCDLCVTTVKDRMTDRVTTVGTEKIVISNDGKTGFAISLLTL
ncbi:MAG: SH3 domain-containing protein, partial [Acidobacteria bacterium]|nr:SH3 domain-containing protein [Acidobacteriota bacterium]